jgi:hypothetical protein
MVTDVAAERYFRENPGETEVIVFPPRGVFPLTATPYRSRHGRQLP